MADSIKIRITGDDSSYRKTLSGLGSAARTAVKGLTVAAAAVSAAWSAVGVVGVRYNAQIEQLQTSFEVMTGSAEKGAAVLERIRQIAAATPFETDGLASTVQLLMNYNLTADEAISSMEMLGDISQGNQDKLSRIAMAYGQMYSAGKVLLEDVKQMTEAGFNPLAEISETTGESMASLYDRISKGTLAVDEITASMVRATSEGGKYFQSMEKQSQTLNGQLSTLKDNAMSLLGDVMTPITDELRDSLLPMANELLGEFATAFEQGGFDGLLDAITGKVPDLLNAAVYAGNKVITGIAKWLPGAMQQIATVLPNALRSVLDMGPQLVSALFDVVSGLVSDLITMLPELVPMIVDGVGDMLSSVVDGVLGLMRGVEDAILGGSPFDALFDDLDEATLERARRGFNIEIEPSIDTNADIESLSNEVSELMDNIADALTDGLPDDEETVGNLEREIRDYFSSAVDEVNEWASEEMSKLDVSSETYDADVANIEAKSEQMVNTLNAQQEAALAFLTSMAGMSTEEVKARLGELDQIESAVQAVMAELEAANAAASAQAEKAAQITRAGAATDADTVTMGFKYEAQMHQNQLAAIRAQYESDMAALREQFGDISSEAYREQAQALENQYETATQAEIDAYGENVRALLRGLGESLANVSPEMAAQAEAAVQGLNMHDKMQSLLMDVQSGIAVSGTDLSDEMTQLLASQLNMDPNTTSEALAERINQAMTIGDTTAITTAISESMNTLWNNAAAAIQGTDLGFANEALAVLIENDVAAGIDGIDLSTSEGKIMALFGELSDSGVEGFSNSLADGADAAYSGASTMAQGGLDGAQDTLQTGSPSKKFYQIGQWAGQGLVNGLNSKYSAVYAAARRLAQAAESGARITLRISSPSKVFEELGMFTGEGFLVGYEKSIREAQRTVRGLTGGLISAANFPARGVATVAQNAQTAGADGDELSRLNVGLYISDRKIAEATADASARVSNARSKRLAAGWGHAR